jgi:hypothetical protein
MDVVVCFSLPVHVDSPAARITTETTGAIIVWVMCLRDKTPFTIEVSVYCIQDYTLLYATGLDLSRFFCSERRG